MKVMLNELDKSTSMILSNNNLTVQGSGAWGGIRATESIKSNKVYLEITLNSISNNNIIMGITNITNSINSYNLQYGYSSTKTKVDFNGNWITYGDSPLYDNDVVSLLLDMDKDNGTLEFWRNGVPQGLAFTDVKNIFGEEIYFVLKIYSSYKATVNFGTTPFKYSMPQGYKPYQIPPSKYLIKQNSNYYSINSELYKKLGQPSNNEELNLWFEKYGLDDLSVLTTIQNKNTEPGVDKGTIGEGKYFEIDFNNNFLGVSEVK